MTLVRKKMWLCGDGDSTNTFVPVVQTLHLILIRNDFPSPLLFLWFGPMSTTLFRKQNWNWNWNDIIETSHNNHQPTIHLLCIAICWNCNLYIFLLQIIVSARITSQEWWAASWLLLSIFFFIPDHLYWTNSLSLLIKQGCRRFFFMRGDYWIWHDNSSETLRGDLSIFGVALDKQSSFSIQERFIQTHSLIFRGFLRVKT